MKLSDWWALRGTQGLSFRNPNQTFYSKVSARENPSWTVNTTDMSVNSWASLYRWGCTQCSVTLSDPLVSWGPAVQEPSGCLHVLWMLMKDWRVSGRRAQQSLFRAQGLLRTQRREMKKEKRTSQKKGFWAAGECFCVAHVLSVQHLESYSQGRPG